MRRPCGTGRLCPRRPHAAIARCVHGTWLCIPSHGPSRLLIVVISVPRSVISSSLFQSFSRPTAGAPHSLPIFTFILRFECVSSRFVVRQVATRWRRKSSRNTAALWVALVAHSLRHFRQRGGHYDLVPGVFTTDRESAVAAVVSFVHERELGAAEAASVLDLPAFGFKLGHGTVAAWSCGGSRRRLRLWHALCKALGRIVRP